MQKSSLDPEMTEKQRIRKQALAARKEISEKEEKCRRLEQHLFASNAWKCADKIFVYISYREEVETRRIVLQALQEGKQVAAPRVSGSEMDFYVLTSLDDVTEGYKGIPEPKEGCKKAEADSSSCILVPGAAFDLEGYRIGYGGGYYDRYLQAHPQSMTVGIAFSGQMYELLPSEEWDLPVKQIASEEGCYPAKKNRTLWNTGMKEEGDQK